MSTWYFVRHGQSVANRDGWLAGHVDSELSPLGQEQAEALIPTLAELPLDEAHCSDLQRAHTTGLVALTDHPLTPTPTPTLRERHLGDWERQSLTSLRASGGMDTLLSWEGRPPGGESQQDVGRRILGWMVEQVPGRRRILFVHGGIIRVITGLLDGLTLEEIGRRKIVNAKLLSREAQRETLVSLLESPAFTRSR